jgi:hypothetical protein
MAFGKQLAREDLWIFSAAFALNAVAAGLIGGALGLPSDESLIRARLGEDLLRGETVGRQGLICSVWFAPIPTLLLLPLLAIPWQPAQLAAPFLVSATFGAIAAVYVYKILRACSLGVSRFAWTALFVLNPMTLWSSGDGSSAVIFAALTMAALHYLLLWTQHMQLRNLALLSLSATLAAISHQMGGIFAAVIVAVICVKLWRTRTDRNRSEGVILLCIFPMIYAAALWHLVNWLIMGDGLFFLRGVYVERQPLTQTAAWQPSLRDAVSDTMQAALFFAPAFVAANALLLLTMMRRAFRTGALLAVSATALLFFWIVSRRFGFNPFDENLSPYASFPRAELFALIPIGCVLFGEFIRGIHETFPRLKVVAESSAVVVALGLIFYNAIWNPAHKHRARLLADAVRRKPPQQIVASPLSAQVREWVMERSERAKKFGSAKVFVCGFGGYVNFYEPPSPGLATLRDGRLFVNTLDFDFESAVQNYRGQDLYLLVPEPIGLSALESIHWKFPQVYEGRGSRRLLFDRDFKGWRLFEIVRAPSEDWPRKTAHAKQP